MNAFEKGITEVRKFLGRIEFGYWLYATNDGDLCVSTMCMTRVDAAPLGELISVSTKRSELLSQADQIIRKLI